MGGYNEGVSRVEAAQAVMALESKVFSRDEELVKVLFERFDFTPPEDFSLTAFDRLVLTKIGDHMRENPGENPLSSVQLVGVVAEEFASLGFPEVVVTKTDIDNYFVVLRGGVPGRPKSQVEKGSALSRNFPEIRDRYNVAQALSVAVEIGEVDLVGVYKTEVQTAVAKLIVAGAKFEEIMEALDPNLKVDAIVDMMVLDLLYSAFDGVGRLRDVVGEAVQQYRDKAVKQDLVDEFESRFFAREYLYPARNPLSKFVNPAIAQLWLDIRAADPRAFLAGNSEYVLLAATEYVRGGESDGAKVGAGKANKVVVERYRELGMSENSNMGSIAVHVAFGIEMDKFSSLNLVDAWHELSAKGWVQTGEK